MARSRSSARALREFGARVRAFRKELGLSQERLAHDAGIHPTYLSSVERGERNVALINLLRLARALGVDPADLVEGLDAQGIGRGH